MLARAQSLSGRPGDALVMLQRLAAMGVVTDAATSDDFSRVRALPGWAEFEARISGMPSADEASQAPPAPKRRHRHVVPPRRRSSRGLRQSRGDGEGRRGEARSRAGPRSRRRVAADDPKPATRAAGPAPLIFSAPGLAAVGLAYDAVSGRFIVGDSKDRRLLVVGERSGRMASLAGVDAGFDEVIGVRD